MCDFDKINKKNLLYRKDIKAIFYCNRFIHHGYLLITPTYHYFLINSTYKVNLFINRKELD